MDQLPLIDDQYLQDNYHDTGFGYLLPELLELFRGQAFMTFQGMEKLYRQGALEHLAGEAHTLRGAAGSIGAARLAGLASALEEAADSRDIHRLSELLTILEETVRQTDQAIAHTLQLLADNSAEPDLFS